MNGTRQIDLFEEEMERNPLASMSSPAGSREYRVKTCPAQDREQASTAPARDYGSSTPVLLASYNPATSSWKTSARCFIEGWMPFSESWPRSGMMRNGTAYQLPPLVPLTDVTESGLLATPTSKANQLAPSMQKWPSCAAIYPTPQAFDALTITQRPGARERRLSKGGCSNLREMVNGQLNPMWVEWLMGFPLGHTDLEP